MTNHPTQAGHTAALPADPLVEALMVIDSGGSQSWAEAAAPQIRAELAKRGVTVGEQTDAK